MMKGSAEKLSVCILGSGNWGSAICGIVGENVRKHGDVFNGERVNVWVYEEMVKVEGSADY